jgi:DNA-binding GntR family transcriptional regulator
MVDMFPEATATTLSEQLSEFEHLVDRFQAMVGADDVSESEVHADALRISELSQEIHLMLTAARSDRIMAEVIELMARFNDALLHLLQNDVSSNDSLLADLRMCSDHISKRASHLCVELKRGFDDVSASSE